MFNPITNICDYPRNVDCESVKGKSPSFFIYTTEKSMSENFDCSFRPVYFLCLLV